VLIKFNARAKHILAVRNLAEDHPIPPTCRVHQTCAKAAYGLILASDIVLRGKR
jgi:hypothetical protein